MTMCVMKNTLISELMSQNLAQNKVEDIVCKLINSNILFLAHNKTLRGPSFNTEHLRRNVFMTNPNYIPPTGYNLSDDPDDPDIYQYVPVKLSLQKFLCDDSVKREVRLSFERFANPGPHDGVYKDYTDGSACKNRSLPSKRLDIVVFQDGFTTTTMITTTRLKHTALGVYMTLGNIRTHLRTKLKAMLKIMLVLEDHVKKYRQKCFEKLVNELKDLEVNGLEFDGEILPVFLQFCTGDNLGQHFLGGFNESFSRGFVCRFCPINVREFKANPNLVKPDRTQAQYNRAVMIVETSNKKSHLGIKESSVFNQLEKFKVCDPGLPPCFGHDLFHGVASWDLAGMIAYFVENNWFSYLTLNRRIDEFQYAPMDSKNKPAPVKTDGTKLGGSAVQNWTLIRLLPLIIEGKIKNPNDPVWKLYLKLKALVEHVAAPAMTEQQIDNLDLIIASYLIAREEVLSNFTIKYHLLKHYCKLIRQIGPLLHLWGMRFEHFHKHFKRIARVCNNFINLLSTLATRHQLLFTYQCDGERFPEYVSKCKPFKIPPGYFEEDVAALISQQNFSPNLQAAASIKINNLTYREKSWLILSQVSPSEINLGNIEAILLDSKQVHFVYRKTKATLIERFGLYKIDDESACSFFFLNIFIIII